MAKRNPLLEDENTPEEKVMAVLKNKPSDPVPVGDGIELTFTRPSYRDKHEGDFWSSLQLKRVRRKYNARLEELRNTYQIPDPVKVGETILDEAALEADEDYQDIVSTLQQYNVFFRFYGVLNNSVSRITVNDQPWVNSDKGKFLFEAFMDNYFYNLPKDPEAFITENCVMEYFKWESDHFPTIEEVKK